MEAAIEETARSFENTSKLAFSWLKDTDRQTLEQGVKVEDNQKSIQDNKERIQGNATEIFSVKALLELHEDKIGRLEEQVKEQENTLIIQGQLVEKLEGQL